ncbi:hypothetical protein FHP29_13645 [Nocardioides albidus]|uniref:Uncharacterized protein n=1 Tax=Nocardioides albidus TaxID=1517589 RepID=A0A5C4VQV1_9ACTN|nr:hypothetical protein [Nocardioides albidus]TNM38314.1 hypothetical protein FHP29_13645 [Nocardioides albidus]
MRDLMTMVPIFAFMMIPLWIPLAAMVFGALHDLVAAPARAARRTPVGRPPARSAHRAEVSPAGPRVAAAGTAG